MPQNNIILALVLLLFTATSCKKEEPHQEPVVTLLSVEKVNIKDCLAKATVTEGTDPIIRTGFCWSKTATEPTKNSDNIEAGQGFGDFEKELKTLDIGAYYYVRAYAQTQNETYYSNVKVYHVGAGWRLATNPQGFGYPANGIDFIDPNTGIVVYNFGFQSLTTDSAVSWTGAHLSTNESAYEVMYVSQNVLFLRQSGGFVKKSTDGGVSWTDINNSTSTGEIWAMDWRSEDLGFIATTNDRIYRTVNSGQTWWYFEVTANGLICDINFPTDSVGYALTSAGELFKTTTKGTFWWLISQPGSNFQYQECDFVNEYEGFVASGSDIKKTTDGGATWTTQWNDPDENISAIDFYDANYGLAGGNGAYMLKTSDGGNTWERAATPLATPFLKDIKMVTPDLGYACFNNGAVYVYY